MAFSEMLYSNRIFFKSMEELKIYCSKYGLCNVASKGYLKLGLLAPCGSFALKGKTRCRCHSAPLISRTKHNKTTGY